MTRMKLASMLGLAVSLGNRLHLHEPVPPSVYVPPGDASLRDMEAEMSLKRLEHRPVVHHNPMNLPKPVVRNRNDRGVAEKSYDDYERIERARAKRLRKVAAREAQRAHQAGRTA